MHPMFGTSFPLYGMFLSLAIMNSLWLSDNFLAFFKCYNFNGFNVFGYECLAFP